jgi:energy-coupling factor transporter transmembrane protein EcfT
MIVPFTLFRYPEDWLNLRFLYLVSLGFCVLLTTGTLYAYKLLQARRYRRFLPFLLLVFYVLATTYTVHTLAGKNRQLADSPDVVQRRAALERAAAASSAESDG